MRRQASNSGEKLTASRRQTRPACLRPAPTAVSTVWARRSQLVAADRPAADAQRRRSRGRGSSPACAICGRVAEHAQRHARPVLLHLDRRGVHVQRPGLPQPRRRVADHLAADVVEVGFQDPDLIRLRTRCVRGRPPAAAAGSAAPPGRASRPRSRWPRSSWPAAGRRRRPRVATIAAPVGVVSSRCDGRCGQRNAAQQFGRGRGRDAHAGRGRC